MLYDMRVTPTTVAVPRVDTHSLLHWRASKAVKACAAADAVDGLAVLQNYTLRLAATAYGVSIGSVARARRLSPEQRQAVRQGKRPLILPRAPSAPSTPPIPPALPGPSTAPATPPVSPVVMSARERLGQIVKEIGMSATLDLLAATEKAAA
jgi:hypothetical protein